MAPTTANLEKKLSGQYRNLISQLNASPTAMARGVSPSAADIQANLDAERLQKEHDKLEAERLKRRWYGAGDETSAEQDVGLINRVLSAFSAPLYSTVGAVEAIAGKGSKRGLANIPANIKERGLFGDLLRQYNAPSLVAAPIGFALDVAFDPLTWLTAGSSALLPRMATGLVKGGVKGLAKGAESGALRTTEFLGRMTPGVRNTRTFKNLIAKTVAANAEYDKVIGRDVVKILEKSVGKSYGAMPRLGEVAERQLQGRNWGDTLINLFKYRNKEWFAAEKNLDEMFQAEMASGTRVTGKTPEELLSNVLARRRELSETLDLEKQLDTASRNLKTTGLTAQGAARKMVDKSIDEGTQLATKAVDYAKAADSENLAMRMGGEAVNDKLFKQSVQIIREMMENKTGVDFIDNLYKNFKGLTIGSVAIGKKIFDLYNNIINIFKISKIGLTSSSYVNATVGNPSMAWMYGLNVAAPGYFSNVKNAAMAMFGKAPKGFFDSIVKDAGWANVIAHYPGLFKKTFHFNPEFLITGRYMDNALNAFRDTLDEAGAAAEKAYARLPKEFQEVAGMRQQLLNKAEISELVAGRMQAGAAKAIAGEKIPEGILKAAREGGEAIRPGQLPRGMEAARTTISSEIYRGSFNVFLNGLKAKGDEGNQFAKFFYSYLTKPMGYYETIDQSYKLGTSLYLSQVGVTETELMKMKRFTDFLSTDVAFDKATDLWKIAPLKAMEISHDIYMNYLAMPAAVKVLRSLPFLGAPFASFMYGMTVKTGRTMMYNPAAISRIESLLGEFTGRPTPLERQAMDMPYYQWYKRAGMVKLPFFQQNPIYMNIANMIPYYTLNIFQPSERQYKNTLGGELLSVVDKMPMLKTPEGQLILDYFIQPLLLQETNPQGIFGQPLYPRDASLAEKAGLVARTAAESVMPGVAGYAGLATGAVAPGTSNIYPSYQWRRLAQAMQGRNPLGIPGTESAPSRVARGVFSTLGVPLYPLETKYVASQEKKKLKK